MNMKVINISPCKNRVVCNANLGHKHMVFRESSPVDEFYSEKRLDMDHTDKPLIQYVNPLILLLNQQRLDRLGSMGIEQWLAGFDLKKVSALDNLRSKCTDQDLCSLIKSRHLQAPAEILSWMRYMSANSDQFNKEIQQLIKESSAVVDQTVDQTADQTSGQTSTNT